MHQAPGGGRVDNGYHRDKDNGLFHPLIFLRPIVKPHNGLRTVGQTLDGKRDNLPHGINHGHHAHIEIPAAAGQAGVIHHLNKAVGHGHGKTG